MEKKFKHSKLKKNSTFYPSYFKKGPIETFERLVLRDLEKLDENNVFTRKKQKGYLNRGEMAGLKSLQYNKDIVIKPADKGGGIVIQNKSDYLNECFRQLNEEEIYKKLKSNPINDMKKSLMVILEKGLQEGILHKKEYDETADTGGNPSPAGTAATTRSFADIRYAAGREGFSSTLRGQMGGRPRTEP